MTKDSIWHLELKGQDLNSYKEFISLNESVSKIPLWDMRQKIKFGIYSWKDKTWILIKNLSPGQNSIVVKLVYKVVRGPRSKHTTLLPFTPLSPSFGSDPLSVLLLKDQTYSCFEVWLALNKHQCVQGMHKMT